MVYLFAVAAALVSAMAGISQRLGLESAPEDSAMRLRLLTHGLRRGIWLVGFGLLLGQFVLQATALRFGQLSVVQPVLTLDLLFVVAILAVFFHRRVGWREWGAATAIVVGLGGFLLLASPAVGRGIPTAAGWVAVTCVVAAASASLVVTTRWGPRWWKATAFGAAAAVLFAYNAALTKATTTIITGGWRHVLTHWEPWAIGVTGLLGFFLLQNALHAGPIAASRATMVTVNPLVSIAIGATIFHEHLRTGHGLVVAEIFALLVLCAGGFGLANSPLVTGVEAEGQHGEVLGTPAVPPP